MWTTTISLVFGGCCSNAITLEQLSSQFPRAGSIITLFQFLFISLYGLPAHLQWTTYGPRFKPRKIPLTAYLVQVVLFYLVSLLNNTAFAYHIPMPVHIIFRSGGLFISMALGFVFAGKRYTPFQVSSVVLVTLGVVLTTLSASSESSSSNALSTYVTGILILTAALVLSGFLGLMQDYTYSTFGRANPAESMFYLHVLALPMFFFVKSDLIRQFQTVFTAKPTIFDIVIPENLSSWQKIPPPLSLSFFTTDGTLRIALPSAIIPLVLNTVTQLVCVAGVHRLTTQVSSLTVTLVLVVRKAVSLIISVFIGNGRDTPVNMEMMWSGATLVMLGTVGYSVGWRDHAKKKKE